MKFIKFIISFKKCDPCPWLARDGRLWQSWVAQLAPNQSISCNESHIRINSWDSPKRWRGYSTSRFPRPVWFCKGSAAKLSFSYRRDFAVPFPRSLCELWIAEQPDLSDSKGDQTFDNKSKVGAFPASC